MRDTVLAELALKYETDEITPSELQLLDARLQASQEDRELFARQLVTGRMLSSLNAPALNKAVIMRALPQSPKGHKGEVMVRVYNNLERSRKRTLAIFAISFLIGAVISFVWISLSSTPMARWTHVDGTVQVSRAGVVKLAKNKGRLKSGDSITVPANASARFRWADGSTITVTGPAQMIVRRNRYGKHIQLQRGIIRGDIRPQPAGKPLRIETPNPDVRVMGTMFDLKVNKTETLLAVTQGRVDMVDSTRTVQVGAQQAALGYNGRIHELGEMNFDRLQRICGRAVFENDFAAQQLKPRWSGEWVRADKRLHKDLTIWQLTRALRSGFSLSESHVLNITFKSKKPGAFRLQVNSMYRAPNVSLVHSVPTEGSDTWQTVSVPLSVFGVVRKEKGIEMTGRMQDWLGVKCHYLSIVAKEDLGITVDRLWVTSAK